jgi:hypothetical protein
LVKRKLRDLPLDFLAARAKADQIEADVLGSTPIVAHVVGGEAVPAPQDRLGPSHEVWL